LRSSSNKLNDTCSFKYASWLKTVREGLALFIIIKEYNTKLQQRQQLLLLLHELYDLRVPTHQLEWRCN
jgi:hypothetical protein